MSIDARKHERELGVEQRFLEHRDQTQIGLDLIEQRRARCAIVDLRDALPAPTPQQVDRFGSDLLFIRDARRADAHGVDEGREIGVRLNAFDLLHGFGAECRAQLGLVDGAGGRGPGVMRARWR